MDLLAGEYPGPHTTILQLIYYFKGTVLRDYSTTLN